MKHTTKKRPHIGFIGQGFIGKNYADDFENRGYNVVRYSLESGYRENGGRIKECDIVFIAVPTPTTPDGFDAGIVESVLPLVGEGRIAVVKSTLLPGGTETLQKKYPDRIILHSPEFLREKSAAYDAAHPGRNLIGLPRESAKHRLAAKRVLSVLPKAPFEAIMRSRETELVKYGGNNFLYAKVVYMNLLYDFAQAAGCRWEKVRDALCADPRIGASHMEPVHQSGHGGKRGRGAGGHCFIKDFAAFSTLYERAVKDPLGSKVLETLRDKNIELLQQSGKDLDLLRGVYGPHR